MRWALLPMMRISRACISLRFSSAAARRRLIHRGQRIADLVGDAGGERPQRRQLDLLDLAMDAVEVFQVNQRLAGLAGRQEARQQHLAAASARRLWRASAALAPCRVLARAGAQAASARSSCTQAAAWLNWRTRPSSPTTSTPSCMSWMICRFRRSWLARSAPC
jgi:hypothetical protein